MMHTITKTTLTNWISSTSPKILEPPSPRTTSGPAHHHQFPTQLPRNTREKVIMASPLRRFSLVFYVPPANAAACKAAIFAAGAGRYPGPGGYTEVAWQATGTGQFRPGDAAKPVIGKVGELEELPEVRIETLIVGEDTVRKAVAALKE
jgi:hypothetical protein